MGDTLFRQVVGLVEAADIRPEALPKAKEVADGELVIGTMTSELMRLWVAMRSIESEEEVAVKRARDELSKGSHSQEVVGRAHREICVLHRRSEAARALFWASLEDEFCHEIEAHPDLGTIALRAGGQVVLFQQKENELLGIIAMSSLAFPGFPF